MKKLNELMNIKEEVDFDGEFIYFPGYYLNLEKFLFKGEQEVDRRTKKDLQDAIKEAKDFIKSAESVLKKL